MSETTSKTRLPRKSRAKDTPKCDNHPDREAKFQTTSGNRHALISFCDECVPPHWRTV